MNRLLKILSGASNQLKLVKEMKISDNSFDNDLKLMRNEKLR